MLSQVCLKDSVHRGCGGGVYPSMHWNRLPSWTDTPSDGQCSGWYASYWNAFLFILKLVTRTCHSEW